MLIERSISLQLHRYIGKDSYVHNYLIRVGNQIKVFLPLKGRGSQKSLLH